MTFAPTIGRALLRVGWSVHLSKIGLMGDALKTRSHYSKLVRFCISARSLERSRQSNDLRTYPPSTWPHFQGTYLPIGISTNHLIIHLLIVFKSTLHTAQSSREKSNCEATIDLNTRDAIYGC